MSGTTHAEANGAREEGESRARRDCRAERVPIPATPLRVTRARRIFVAFFIFYFLRAAGENVCVLYLRIF